MVKGIRRPDVKIDVKEQTHQEQLLNVITAYIADSLLVSWRNEKMEAYKRVLMQFTLIEINNCH